MSGIALLMNWVKKQKRPECENWGIPLEIAIMIMMKKIKFPQGHSQPPFLSIFLLPEAFPTGTAR